MSIRTEAIEVLDLTIALKLSQAQPFPGVMNENRNKDFSIYLGVLSWPWALGFNFGDFINSQLI